MTCWSAVTCHRFGPRRPVAVVPSFAWHYAFQRTHDSCDRSQKTKALTGQRTPKKRSLRDTAHYLRKWFRIFDGLSNAERFDRSFHIVNPDDVGSFENGGSHSSHCAVEASVRRGGVAVVVGQ